MAMIIFCGGCTPYVQSTAYKVMFIPKSQISNFWKVAINGFNTAIAEYNMEGELRSTLDEEDIEGQIDIVNQAIEEKFDAIIISSIGYEELAPAIERAISENIKVIVIDSDVNAPSVKVRISTDNFAAGYKMGQKMAEMMRFKGTIGMLTFDENTENSAKRISGFTTAIEKHKNIQIKYNVVTKSTEGESQAKAEQMIRNNPDLDGMVAFNEIISLGMGRSVEKLHREDLICVGFDNNTELIDYLENGVMDVLVLQNQYAMGYLGVKYAFDSLSQKTSKASNIDTGVYIVTKDNMYNPNMQTALFPFE